MPLNAPMAIPTAREHHDREIGVHHQARPVQRTVEHQPRREHRRDADDRFQRQVEPPDDQDDRFGEHQDGELRRLLQDVDEVDLRQKGRMQEAAGDQRDDDQLEKRQLVAKAQPQARSRAQALSSTRISARPRLLPHAFHCGDHSCSCQAPVNSRTILPREHHHDPVADRQFVRSRRRPEAPPSRVSRMMSKSACFDAMSTPAVG